MSQLNQDNLDDFEQDFTLNKRYRIVEELKRTGQGRVYVVEDTQNSNEK